MAVQETLEAEQLCDDGDQYHNQLENGVPDHRRVQGRHSLIGSILFLPSSLLHLYVLLGQLIDDGCLLRYLLVFPLFFR